MLKNELKRYLHGKKKKDLKKGGLKKEKCSKRRLRGWNTQPRVEPHINRRRRIRPPSIAVNLTTRLSKPTQEKPGQIQPQMGSDCYCCLLSMDVMTY